MPVYAQRINEIIDEDMTTEYTSNAERGELIKIHVRAEMIQFATRKKCSNQNILEALEKKLHEINKHIQNEAVSQVQQQLPISLTERSKDDLHEIQKEIDELLEIKAKGAMVRSSANWVALGKKPTSYFLGLQKQNFNHKSINRVMLSDQTVTTHARIILKEQQRFYEVLYRSSQIEFDPGYLQGLQGIFVERQDRIKLDRVLDIYEIRTAIKQLKPT